MGQIEELLEAQREIMRQIADLALDQRLKREWYCAAECAELKGVSPAFLSLHSWARPLGGRGSKTIARRPRWHRSAVREWLTQSDDTLINLYGKGGADEKRGATGSVGARRASLPAPGN
jgi:hypothetical protein